MSTSRRRPSDRPTADRPTADDVIARVRRLEAEVAGLRRGMRTRGLIEQAKGRLAERLGVDAEAAFRYLAQRSQETNVTVVDLAADLAGADRPANPADPVDPVDPADLAVVRHTLRLRASLDWEPDAAGLLRAVADDEALGVVAAALWRVEPSGALSLLAAHGWSERVASNWRWVPAGVRTAAGVAAERGQPIMDAADAGRPVVGSPGPRAAIPIDGNGVVVAVLELVWPPDQPANPSVWSAVRTTTDAIADRLAHSVVEPDRPEAEPWLTVALDAVDGPAAVLTPLWSDAGTVEDFRIDLANAAAVDQWRPAGSPVGRRLFDVAPNLLYDNGFDGLVAAFEGDPPRSGPVRAERVGPRLFATWPGGDDDPTEVRLSLMEEEGEFGWAQWSPSGTAVRCSPGFFRLLGHRPGREPVGLGWLAAAAGDDGPRLLSTMDEVGQTGRPATIALTLRRADGQPRAFRLILTPRPDATLMLLQDRTELGRAEQAVVAAAERLAAQRMQAGLEREYGKQLRQAFFPAPWARHRHGPLTVIGRHTAPGGIQTFRGDFYEITEAGDQLLIAIGDVFGSGVPAAHTMVRVRHSVGLLGLAGHGPAEMLDLINHELCTEADPPLASMVLAAIMPDAETVCWAQAGHYSPILIRNGQARTGRRPRGDLLGLTRTTRYTQHRLRLQGGDLLVLFTDGVFQQWKQADAPVRRLTDACEEAVRAGDVDALFARLLPPAEDEACLAVIQRPAAG